MTISMTGSTLGCGIEIAGAKFSLGIMKALGMCGDDFNYTGNCSGWRAILASTEDDMTDETKRQILAHNEFGLKIGCWTYPKLAYVPVKSDWKARIVEDNPTVLEAPPKAPAVDPRQP